MSEIDSEEVEEEEEIQDPLGGRAHVDRISGKVKWELSDSFHLRLLIHYVGDIH